MRSLLSVQGGATGSAFPSTGRLGMALEGRDSEEIISHYYSGTTVSSASATDVSSYLLTNPSPLWVGISQNRTTLTFAMTGGGADLCQYGDGEGPCPKAVHPQDGETWKFYVNASGKCVFERVMPASPLVQGSPGDCGASVTPASNATISVIGDYTYSNGVLRFRAVPENPETFHVMFQTSVESYMRGIAEMPTSWPAQALKAQAIAARSYAMSTASVIGPESGFSPERKSKCWCHVYDDTRSQVFKGDKLLTSQAWQSAVLTTAGQVVSYQGTLVRAFYSSSSGGMTENVADVWGGSGVPWLVSVDDHWAHLPGVANPRSTWSRVRSGTDVATTVGLDSISDIQVSHRQSGAASLVQVSGKKGGVEQTISISGYSLRSKLGLPSHYFEVEGFSPSQPITNAYDIPNGSGVPFGWVDSAVGGKEEMTVRGWAIDPDTSLPINVHVYVDGKFRKNVLADDSRPDVEAAYANGRYHGFNITLGVTAGSHTVCVYAINAPSKTSNPKIGCRLVSVASADTDPPSDPPPSDPPPSDDPAPPTEGRQPIAWLDSVTVENGYLNTAGWAVDPDVPASSVSIHVYVDGAFFMGGPADQRRVDVDRALGYGEYHGFSLTMPVDPGPHRVCVFAINLPEKKDNPLIGCRNVG